MKKIKLLPSSLEESSKLSCALVIGYGQFSDAEKESAQDLCFKMKGNPLLISLAACQINRYNLRERRAIIALSSFNLCCPDNPLRWSNQEECFGTTEALIKCGQFSAVVLHVLGMFSLLDAGMVLWNS